MSSPQVAEDGDGKQAVVIGQNLRKIRAVRGVSLAQLSREAHVARGTLHQLESGRGNPRMDTLYALARVLNVALSDLVTAPASERTVIRALEGVRVGTAGLETRLLRGFSLSNGLLELSELTVVPGCEIVNDPHQPGIFEHVLISSGVLRTGPVGEEEVLCAGDYMKFRGDRQHRYHALDGPVSATLLMEYPSQVGMHDLLGQ